MAQDFPNLTPEEQPQEGVPTPQPPYPPAQSFPEQQVYPGPVQSYPSATPLPAKKSNRTWIIIAVVVVLLCCCCLLAAGAWLWNNGDNLMRDWEFQYNSLMPVFTALV